VKFDKLAAVLPRLYGRADAAALLRGLSKSATADEDGRALDGALAALAPAPMQSSASNGSGGRAQDERSSQAEPQFPAERSQHGL